MTNSEVAPLPFGIRHSFWFLIFGFVISTRRSALAWTVAGGPVGSW
jgi:hypothetical protein